MRPTVPRTAPWARRERRGAPRGAAAAAGALLFLAPVATAHEFEVHVIEPTPDWCEVLHAEVHAADVVELLPGTYPGGCDLTLGGEPELNEALLVMGTGDERTVIGADADGLSLRISGEPTRLYHLALEGRLEVVANNATVDDSSAGCIEVDDQLPRFALLFSEVSQLVVNTDDTVVRGNVLDQLEVGSLTGLVGDNLVSGDVVSTIPTHRNLVHGDLSTTGDAHFNIVVGTTTASAELFGNTLLGAVSGTPDARNNLTTTADLPAAQGNLRCASCLADEALLDVQPTGQALTHELVEAPGALLDYCFTPPETVGAVDALGGPWSPAERDLFGCSPGMPVRPEPPPTTCVAEPADTATDTGITPPVDSTPVDTAPTADTGTLPPQATADTGTVVTAPPDDSSTTTPPELTVGPKEGGCHSLGAAGLAPTVAWWPLLSLLVARRR